MEKRRRTPRKEKQFAPPESVWTDTIIHRLRTNTVVVTVYAWWSSRAVPFLFAVFIAAPIGLVILPFFVLKFYRNYRRRRKYEVRLMRENPERIRGTATRPH